MSGDSQSNQNFKQDVNFLNNPLWIPNPRAVNTGKDWIDNDGFVYSCAGSPPAKTDIIFLYYLMYTSQKNDWTSTLTLSHFKILSACGAPSGKKSKARLEESLSRWKRVTLSFKGTFYDGIKYSIKEFSIINDWHIVEGSNDIKIELNASWLEKIKNSSFFKFISFNQLKKVRSPLAFRLYEILIKTFYKRSEWEIGVHKLARKIPMAETQYSHIAPKIKTAVQNINKSDTDFYVDVEIIKQGRNQGKFIFRKKDPLKKALPSETPETPAPDPVKLPQHIIELIPEKHRVSCLALCVEIFEKYGENGLKFYIDMTNESNPSKNYGGMMSYFFKNETNFYEEYQAIEEETRRAKAQLLEKQKKLLEQQQQESEQQQQQLLKNKEARDLISRMDDQELQKLDDFIKDQDLNDFERSRFTKGKRDLLRVSFFDDYQIFQENDYSFDPGM